MSAPEPAPLRFGESELYQLLIESVVDYAIFVLDPNGHVVTWNPGAQRLKGYSTQEILGRHFSVFYPEEDVRAGKPQRMLGTAIRDGRVQDEGWRVRKDGSRFWALVVITALHDDAGKLVGFAKVTRDLSARRAAEEQARRLAAEEASRTTAEGLNDELRTLNEQLRQESRRTREFALEVEQSNAQVEESLAEVEAGREALQATERRLRFLLRAGDVLSQSLDYEDRLRELAQTLVPEIADWCIVDLDADADAGLASEVAVAHVDKGKARLARELRRRYPPDPAAQRGVPHVLRTGRPELLTTITDEMLVAEARDADHLALLRDLELGSAMIVPLNARGRTVGTITLVAGDAGRRFGESDLVFAMEIARRAALAVDNALLHRQALEAVRAAEAAADAKTRFLAVMSHELRTPLNAIGGYAELLAMGVRGPITREQQLDLERIMKNHRSLLALINDVLDYAKLESGSMPLDVRVVNVRHELEEIESLVSPQLQAKRITYEYTRCAPAVTVCADPRSLRQILLNLLSNAIKFTGEGGRITITCIDPESDERGAGSREPGAESRVRITVKDTGIGIAADKLEDIFEPFVQLDRDSSHPKEGTGLGLSISRDLARAMQGDLTVESVRGQGSTFIIELPSGANGALCEPMSRPNP